MPALCIIPERALRDPEITGARLFALCAIGRFTSRTGKGVWARNSTIAAVAGLDERHYRRALQWLVGRGYVRKTTRLKADGSADTNFLEIVLDDPTPTSVELASDGDEPTDEVGAESAPTPRAKAARTPVGADSARTPRATVAPRVGADSAHQTSYLNSTASPTPGVDPTSLAGEFAHDEHRRAYLAMRTSHRHPLIFDGSLRTVHEPPTGGPAYPWDVIGAGLLEQLSNAETFNVNRLRGYCRMHQTGVVRPSTGRSGPRTDDAEAVRVGTQLLTPAAIWQHCVDAGLTSPMITRETAIEAVAKLHARGLVADPDAFLAMAMAIEPAQLAEIDFPPRRDERLRERLAAWSRQPGRAA